MRTNHVKQAIHEGRPTIGTWLSLSSVIAAERMALAGPMVPTADQARAVVASCKYPPEGVRSLAGGRNDAAWGTDTASYFARANEEILVCVQIEHPRALENLDEIVSVPGVDCAFVGPQDLTATLGIKPAQLDSPDPRYQEALDKVLA